MKQECRLTSLWSLWIAIPAIAAAISIWRGWPAAVLVALVGVMAEIGYIRNFRHLSSWLGYGLVDDVRPAHRVTPERTVPHVTLYTAAGCPFCPLVRERLEQLRQELWFDLDEQDVTFRPQTLRARGIQSVPVVEVDGRCLVGNQTSAALAAFLTGEELRAAS